MANPGGWRVLRLSGLLLLAILQLGLVVRPELALRALWSGLVPLLPALFLVHPGLWRDVCPLATLETFVSRFGRRARPGREWTMSAGAAGAALFALLVPARAVLFDGSPAAVMAAAVAACGIAVVGGIFFGWKSGFCNAFCPMLSIERLYGQSPLISMANGRCGTCTLCTAGGCLDLAGGRSIPQVLGPSRRSNAWLRTPFGLFVMCFPGLILGYWLVAGMEVPDGALTGGPSRGAPARVAWAYGVTGICALATAVVGRGIVAALRPDWKSTLRVIAASSFLLFYWFAAADVAATWGLGATGRWAIRAGSGCLVALWLRTRVHRSPLLERVDGGP